jgi:hypothetical protein
MCDRSSISLDDIRSASKMRAEEEHDIAEEEHDIAEEEHDMKVRDA